MAPQSFHWEKFYIHFENKSDTRLTKITCITLGLTIHFRVAVAHQPLTVPLPFVRRHPSTVESKYKETLCRTS